MALDSDLGDQFEFTQNKWANNARFPKVPPGVRAPGVDLVIGQTPSDGPCPPIEGADKWASRRKPTGHFHVVDAIPRAVTTRGGAYFFMPSLSFLRSL